MFARLRALFPHTWDARTAHGVDHYIANSEFVAGRIRKVYGRKAAVVHPPVDVARFTLSRQKADFYLTVSRLVPYKRIPLIVEAFASTPTRRLVVIGDGPEMAAVRARQTSNVTIVGYQSREIVSDYMRRARAFLFAAEEDFGIVALEAQACGTPVIAYARGGSLETVVGGKDAGPARTGVPFFEQTVSAIASAVEEFELVERHLSADACRRNALAFTRERFRRNFQTEIEIAMAAHGEHAESATGSVSPLAIARR